MTYDTVEICLFDSYGWENKAYKQYFRSVLINIFNILIMWQ